jgi:hypothetical protein
MAARPQNIGIKAIELYFPSQASHSSSKYTRALLPAAVPLVLTRLTILFAVR